MKEIKFFEGIPTGKRFDEYSKEELSVLPPIPELVPGKDYPAYYSKAPLYWVGYKWELIFD